MPTRVRVQTTPGGLVGRMFLIFAFGVLATLYVDHRQEWGTATGQPAATQPSATPQPSPAPAATPTAKPTAASSSPAPPPGMKPGGTYLLGIYLPPPGSNDPSR